MHMLNARDEMDTTIESEIDLNFVISVEGYKNRPYVLDPAKFPKSGITLGWGVDLGQWDARTFITTLRMYFDEANVKRLYEKVRPFLGLKGEAAKEKLSLAVRTFTPDDVYVLSLAVTSYFLNYLKSVCPEWSSLTRREKTVVFATVWHRGFGVLRRRNLIGRFVRTVLKRDLEKARLILKELIVHDPTFAGRHRKTAAYLA